MREERNTDHLLIKKLKELGTYALHVYYEGSWYSKKRHIYPGHRHPSEKDVQKMNLVFDSKRHLFPDELYNEIIERWEKDNVELILHTEMNKMTSKEYDEYYLLK